MNSPIKVFNIPLGILEARYWQEAGFCLSCGEFFSQKVAPGLQEKCPFCEEDTYYDVDFLIKKEILIGIG